MIANRISVVGNTNLDVIVPETDALPAAGTEQLVGTIEIRLGGSAGNLAYRCAGLGVETMLTSRVGDDVSARILAELLDVPSLDSILLRDPAAPSGVTVAIEAEFRDRAFLSSLGAMANLVPADVPDDRFDCRFFALAGYFLLPSMQGAPAAQLFGKARARGATTMLDTGWPPIGWTPEVRERLLDVLAHVDIFMPNEDELCGLTGNMDAPCAAVELARGSSTMVVLKRGMRGASLASPAGDWFECPTREIRAIDSIGAGDSFNAGFLVSAADGADWQTCLVQAADYASRLVAMPPERRGAEPLVMVPCP